MLLILTLFDTRQETTKTDMGDTPSLECGSHELLKQRGYTTLALSPDNPSFAGVRCCWRSLPSPGAAESSEGERLHRGDVSLLVSSKEGMLSN